MDSINSNDDDNSNDDNNNDDVDDNNNDNTNFFSPTLPSFPSRFLECLNLAFNGLSSPDILLINDILRRHRSVIDLDLTGNPLTPEDGILIAAAMENNSRVRRETRWERIW